MKLSTHALTLAGVLLGLSAQGQDRAPEPSREALEFFEKKIRPVLVEKCYKCHSSQAEKLKAGLRLDSREALLKGGESGPALVPGDPEKSLLIKAIRYSDENLQMPAKEKLPDEQIADFVAWVKMGAPDPRGAAPAHAPAPGPDLAEARKFWSFQPPRPSPLPAVSDKGWCRTPVDSFILARLEEKGLKPAPEADRRTFIRRATFDLLGLPPTAEEIDAFLADGSPQACETLIDRLLASPHYGERWGRHWLDVARYADTKEWVVAEERRLAYAYTYRDWVIRAFNEDLPYDEFILQQIAADRLPTAGDKRTLAALGFLTVGRSFLNRIPDIIDDRIDVVTRGVLGLSVQCARCHDHKYDPVPTRDYYSLYGVFASALQPREYPLISDAPARTPDYLAFEKELQAKEGIILKFKADRHGQIMAGYRTAPQISDYLLASRDARDMTEEQVRVLARERRLNSAMLRRWASTLKKPGDPVFAPWLALASLPEGEFAERAREVVSNLGEANPLVRETLAEPPSTLREAAERYGVLLAGFDRAAALANPTEEAVRMAVCGPEAPTNMPVAEIDQFLNGEDRDKMRKLKRDVDELHNHPGAPPRAMTLDEQPSPHSPRVFVRGNPATPGEEVPRQFLAVLCSDSRVPYKDGGRLDLARALTSRENPLTARVFANRVWTHHFGAGIVRTPSDFGTRGERPTHPELLDWLADAFMDRNWSVKKLHKLVMLSSAYRQSSAGDPATVRADPLNLLVGRMNRVRLEFESLRDALLAVAGDLDRAAGGRSVPLGSAPFSRRRTVYGHVDRLNLDNVYRVFDFPIPDMHAPRRYTTTVPMQALFMMNSPFVQERAERLARRPEVAAETDPEQRIQRLYRLVFGRAASTREVALGLEFVKSQDPNPAAAAPIWQYGFGAKDFAPLPHYTGSAWQGGAKLPDAKTGWCQLTASGGHAGDDAARAAVRRWTAPRDGTVSISGTLAHREKAGDGVRGRIVSSAQGEIASWVVARLEVETRLAGLEVKRGETIDFAVDCRAEPNSDSFLWAPVVKMAGPDEEWSALSGFGGPAPKPPAPLSPWEKYAQVLLESNEFTFVD